MVTLMAMTPEQKVDWDARLAERKRLQAYHATPEGREAKFQEEQAAKVFRAARDADWLFNERLPSIAREKGFTTFVKRPTNLPQGHDGPDMSEEMLEWLAENTGERGVDWQVYAGPAFAKSTYDQFHEARKRQWRCSTTIDRRVVRDLDYLAEDFKSDLFAFTDADKAFEFKLRWR
jgi:hypothetical protein